MDKKQNKKFSVREELLKRVENDDFLQLLWAITELVVKDSEKKQKLCKKKKK